MIEAEVRYRIDQSLQAKGWVLDPQRTDQNVYFESAVNSKLNSLQRRKLGRGRPDYTLFYHHEPLAIIEAKKSRITQLESAFFQAEEYAEKINVGMVFVSNGSMFKSLHLESQAPLILNGLEVNEPLTLSSLRKFHIERKHKVNTIEHSIINSRQELIKKFSELNDDLRGAGIRAGIERFSEFANILFLKLLSEKGNSDIWDTLVSQPVSNLSQHINRIVLDSLSDQYGGEVMIESQIQDNEVLQKIILAISGLQLSSVDEDIKGVAFEHFIQKTTSTQNDLGEYFTPRHIVRFMVKLLNPEFGKTLYDPFCGTGGFLTEGFKHLSHQIGNSLNANNVLQRESVFGGELTTTARIAKMNMILFGDGHSGVRRQDSLKTKSDYQYDYVLSNIPFSQPITDTVKKQFEGLGNNGDSACVLRCFNSLKKGGRMSIVVPEGFIFNKEYARLRKFLFQNSKVLLIAHLPNKCFLPYTPVKTAILYLVDKGVGKTTWFYRVKVKNDGYTLDTARNKIDGSNDLDEILYSFEQSDVPNSLLVEKADLKVVYVENLESDSGFHLREPWPQSNDFDYVELQEIAHLNNGDPITEATTTVGSVPVIAAGGGTSPYTHGEANYQGNVITVSKSGAYAGYVWWHDEPIWASDSIAIQSKDESSFMTKFLFICLKSQQNEIYLRQQGTAQPHIYIPHIRSFPIPKLSYNDQKKLLQEYQKTETELSEIQNRLETSKQKLDDIIQSVY